MNYANLHLHSTYSDAAFTPQQLVLIGKALGYEALALTDHETDGGWHEFRYSAERNGIKPILGAEFYGRHATHSIHLTALDYNYDDPGIRAFIRSRCEAMTEYTRLRFQRAVDNGWIDCITWDQILSLVGPDTWICHDTVQCLVKTLRLVPYDFNWSEFRQKTWFCPEVKQWKTPSPTAQEVIQVVRAAGGVVAAAHPEGIMNHIGELVEMGLNGIEVSHPEISQETAEQAAEAAKTYNLYRCGGTDHTGPMSACGGKLAVPVFNGISEEDLNILLERRLG